MTINELFNKGATANVHEIADAWLDLCVVLFDNPKHVKMAEAMCGAIKSNVSVEAPKEEEAQE